MISIKTTTLSLAAATLAACGGGTTSVPMLDFSTITYVTHDQTELDFIAAGARSIGNTAPADLPMTGSAVAYAGYIELETAASGRSDTDVAGQLDLTVSLADDTFGGAVTQIAGRDGSQYAGSLAVTGGAITRGNAGPQTVSAAIAGDAVDAQGDTLAVDAALTGQFNGPAGQYIDGLITGTVTTNGTVTPIGDGDFIVERSN